MFNVSHTDTCYYNVEIHYLQESLQYTIKLHLVIIIENIQHLLPITFPRNAIVNNYYIV